MIGKMKTRDRLIQILEASPNQWISGEYLAETFSLSRAAVWKAANSLRSEGYLIDAVRSKGYRLVTDADIMSDLGIIQYLSPDCRNLDIRVLSEVGSTNTLLKEKADAGSPEGTVLIADMQTDGKGRAGRRFYSPADTGIYMSILLRPVETEPSRGLRFTTMAAAAACDAIHDVSGKEPGIKWVNDIYLDCKKVCGILTEGSLSMESGLLDHVVLGIGINAYCPEGGFPPALKDIAGAVYDEKQMDGRNRLAAGFLNRFFAYYCQKDSDSFTKTYRRHSIVIGKEVTVISGASKRRALALSIDNDFRLVVQYEDGRTEHLSTGEVSIRLENDKSGVSSGD